MIIIYYIGLTNNLINNLINKFSVCHWRTERDTYKSWLVW